MLTGASSASLAPFARMLQSQCSSPITISSGSAFGAKDQPEGTLITTDPEDVLRLKKMRSWTSEDRAACQVVVIVRDPRDVLLERRDWAGDGFGQGYDHALHRSSDDIVTLTGPGLLFVHETLERMAARDPAIMIIRHEDIEARPDLVVAALEGLTGLGFRRGVRASASVGWPFADRSFRHRNALGLLTDLERDRLVRQFRLAPELFGILDRWDYEVTGDRRWYDELGMRSPGGLEDTPGLIVGFHTTDALYSREALRMRESISRLALPLELTPIDPTDSWLAGVQIKPAFLAKARRRLRGPLLYVDVDAVIHADPWPYLRAYDGDVAVAGHHGQAILSGTILINDTSGAQTFLDEWAEEQSGSPGHWDQVCLETVAKRHRLGDRGVSVQYLPPEMCCVFNRKFSPPIVAVIEHLQASREQFADASDEGHVRNLDSRRRRVQELEASATLGPGPSAPTGPAQPKASLAYSDQSPMERRASTVHMLAARQSDLERWARPQNFKADWSSRAQLVAALIAPGSSVLDIGCGAMDLERALPDGCDYIPADIVAHDPRTRVIDLNQGQLPDVDADVVTLLGVIEYIHDPATLLAAMSDRWSRVILTYNPVDLDEGRDRYSHGWFNSLTMAELIATAEGLGYRLQMSVPHGRRERVIDLTLEAGAA